MKGLRATQWRLLELKAEAEGGEIELTDRGEAFAYLVWKYRPFACGLKDTVAEAAVQRKQIDATLGSNVRSQKRTDRILSGSA